MSGTHLLVGDEQHLPASGQLAQGEGAEVGDAGVVEDGHSSSAVSTVRPSRTLSLVSRTLFAPNCQVPPCSVVLVEE
ncbi:hypothetical protein ACWDKQ_31940 [Saccharopolyspora sp. NPDC000995]